MDFAAGSSSELAKQKLAKHSEYTVSGPGLGPINSATLIRDPKHLLFTLSRYKFISKLLKGKSRVIEIGCHEATGSLIVAKEVEHLTAIDLQTDVIEFCQREYERFNLNISFYCLDALDTLSALTNNGKQKFDAAFLLDVLEHIDPEQENQLMGNIINVLSDTGALIIGIPSIESQPYASPVSKVQHINCKSLDSLKFLVEKYFHNVFMFGMNDEVLHTGFAPMCQYIFAVATNPKSIKVSQ